MILDNQGKPMLNGQKVPLPNEPQKSPRFVQKQKPEVFFKKGALKRFANITRKHLCWSHSLKKKLVKLLRISILKNI